jgi:ABC-type uncharacterized transport system involved in gliding motility auxiliary subunit
MRRLGNAAVILGIVLLGVAGALWVTRPHWEIPRAVALVLGAVGLLFGVYANFGLLRDLLSRRTARYGINVAVMVLLVLGVIVLVEAVSYRHNWRLDVTENRRNSLSPQTKKVLQSLAVNVQAVAFVRPDQPQKRVAEDLFKQYTSYSGGKFSWQVVDPDRNPGLAKRYGVQAYGTVVLEAKVKDQLKEEKLTDAAEEKLTNGLIRVTREGKRVIYVLTGHGEKALGSQERTGFSEAKSAIEKANYEIKELTLLRGEGKVPDDAAILLIPGPQKDLLPQELQATEKYVARGGKLFLMLDPFVADGLIPFLQKYGVTAGRDVIVDRLSRAFGGDYLLPVVLQYEGHAITKEFNIATVYGVVRSITPQDKPPEGVTVQALAKSSAGQGSWAETDREALEKRGEATFTPGKDIPGPVPIAAVATVPAKDAAEDRKGAKARVVVFGDSDWTSNNLLNVQGNRDLFLNTISWLAEEEDLIAVRPKESRSTPVFLTANQGQLLFWLPVVVLPGAVLIVGISVLTRRRRIH